MARRNSSAAPAALSRSPFRCPFDSPPLLAVGGHLKNVFALARGRFAYQSQHLGDLENLTGLDFFRESLAHLMRTFEIEPQTVVARSPSRLSLHHAGQRVGRRARFASYRRAASPRAHRRLHGRARAYGPVIGLALDGTGYGTDGKIWGGEVLIGRLRRASSASPISTTSPCPAAKPRSASRGAWRLATCMRPASTLNRLRS